MPKRGGDEPPFVTRIVASYAMLAVLATWLITIVAVVVWGARDLARPSGAIVYWARQYAGRPSPVLKADSITQSK
jgi:hypothetical protein